MSTLDLIMRQPLVYRLRMAPFAGKKFAPIAAHNDMKRIRRVLDVGCGPGTDARTSLLPIISASPMLSRAAVNASYG
jgi:hypothetical protein